MLGSKLKWSSASSVGTRNERSSTSGKTMMEEVVEVARFRSLPKYRIADGLLSVSFWMVRNLSCHRCQISHKRFTVCMGSKQYPHVC